MVWYGMVWYGVVWCSVMWCNVVCSMSWRGVIIENYIILWSACVITYSRSISCACFCPNASLKLRPTDKHPGEFFRCIEISLRVTLQQKLVKNKKITNNNKTMQLRTCKIDLLFRFSDTIQYVQQPLFWFLLVCFWVYQSVCKDSKLSIIYREYNMISSKSGGNTCPIGLEYSVGKLLPKTTCQQQKFFICMSLTPSLTWLPVCTSRDWI